MPVEALTEKSVSVSSETAEIDAKARQSSESIGELFWAHERGAHETLSKDASLLRTQSPDLSAAAGFLYSAERL